MDHATLRKSDRMNLLSSYLFFATFIITISMAPHSATSDTIFGVYAEATYWQGDISGAFNSAGTSNIDSDQLDFSSDGQTSLALSIEHPIPLIPNFKLAMHDISSTSSTSLSEDINFLGESYNAGTSIESELDLTHVEASLYYEVLDNWVSLDFGLTAKKFDGKTSIQQGTRMSEAKIDETLPLLMGKAIFELPFTGISAQILHMGLSLDDHKAQDTRLSLHYEHKNFISAFVAYRDFTLELDAKNIIETNLSTKGPMIGIQLHL